MHSRHLVPVSEVLVGLCVMKRSIDLNQSELPPVERKYYNRIHEEVNRAVARLEARGFFRDEPPKRRFGRYNKRSGSK